MGYRVASDKQTVRNCLFLGWMLALPLAGESATATSVEARLLTPVSSYSSKSGTELTAELATGVCFTDGASLPEGVILRGTLERVHKVGLGLVHETAGMTFGFNELRLPDGRAFPVTARLRSIDNARERVDSHGSIHGIRATESLSNRAGERLAFLVMGHPAIMLPLFAEIEYGAGTELVLDVTFPADLGEVERCAELEPSAEERLSLGDLVAAIPAWSYSKRQHLPMDIVNLVFVGSEEQVASAFRSAGWTGSRRNSMGSGFGAIRAIAERNGDADAPMRTLLLDGAEPDFSLQKSLNTFEKRHHLRIWKRAPEFEGRTVWASAATRDLGATFAMHPFGFTHQIQDAVDLERDKVVSDLRFTGCMDAVYYVPRPNLAEAFETDYRRGVRTDGRVAVVLLNSCQSPRLDLAEQSPAKEPFAVRTIRRVTLTARNHFLRDNWWWRCADGARLTFLAVRKWSRERRDERLARQERESILAKAARSPAPARLPLEPPAGRLPAVTPTLPDTLTPASPSIALVDSIDSTAPVEVLPAVAAAPAIFFLTPATLMMPGALWPLAEPLVSAAAAPIGPQ
jgi:LssY C-terminus